jgi:ABC-2 type transport system permease protein
MKLITLIKQDFKNLFTNPTVILFSLAYPLVLILLFGFLFSNLYGEKVTSYDYYGVTLMIFLILSAATIPSNTFMEERIKQGNIRIAYAPVNRVEVYMSKIISSYIFVGGFFTFDLSILNVSGVVNYGGGNFIYVLILFLSLLFFSVTLGSALCMIVRNENLTNMVISLFTSILALISGVFFSANSLGSIVSKISKLSPLKWIIDTIFQVIYDGNLQNFGMTIAMTLGMSLIFLIIINFRYRPEDFI